MKGVNTLLSEDKKQQLAKREKENEFFRTALKEARLKKKLSQRELSDKTEISASYIQQLELGHRRTPSVKILFTLAKALDITVDDLFPNIGESYLFSNKLTLSSVTLSKSDNITLLSTILKNHYSSNMNLINSNDDFIELCINNKIIIYTHAEFEKFLEYVVQSFPNFKLAIDSIKNVK